MLNIKCASIGLAVATAGGALLISAPLQTAQAQSDLVQGSHSRHRFYHRHAHANLNRNRPRIFIRIYIYNKNNNLAIAGQQQREQQQQRQREFDPGRTHRFPRPVPDLTPTTTAAQDATTDRANRPYVLRDRPTVQNDQGVARPNQPTRQQAVSHSEPSSAQHSPADSFWGNSGW